MKDHLNNLYEADLCEFRKLTYYDDLKIKNYINYKINNQKLHWEDIITFVNIGLDREYYTGIEPILDSSCQTVLVNKYRQLPQNFIPEDLEMIAICFNPYGLVLRREARIAFEIMCHAAAKENIKLEAISTFRSYDYQKTVYFKNITPEISLEEYQQIRDKVSARPGHSEHQTGLAVDINDLEQTFADTPAGQWLAINAYQYGYILRYPSGKEHITGYDYEPWHFRYLGKELAEAVNFSGLTFDEFFIRYLS